MDTFNSLYFNPPPASNPTYPSVPNNDELENQVQRWANWVKFIAVFNIIGSSITLLLYLMQLVISSEMPNVIALVLQIVDIGVGVIGYRFSENKTSRIAIVYLVALVACIIITSTMCFYLYYEIYAYLCKELQKIENIKCVDNDIWALSIISTIIILFVQIFMCSPVMYCVVKLKKTAEVLEESRRLSNSNQGIELKDVHDYNESEL